MKKNDSLTFEQALLELESVVKKLETGNIELESAITHYERAHYLKDLCQKKLSQAKLQIEQVIKKETGDIETVPFNNEKNAGTIEN